MNTITITNLVTQTTDRFENRSLDACIQALKNLDYAVRFDDERGCYIAFSIRDGYIDYEVHVS